MAPRPLVATTSLSVPEAVAAVTSTLEQAGVTLFTSVDHAGGARAAGLELDDEVLLVFGNAAVGTSLMQADPLAGLDLPLRLLVWSGEGGTRLAFHDPHELADAYQVGPAAHVLGTLRALLDRLVHAAAGAPAA